MDQDTFFDEAQDGYATFTGTSMATPHVTGAAALLLVQNPTLTVGQLKSLLLNTSDLIPDLVGLTVTGGREFPAPAPPASPPGRPGACC